MQINSYVYIIHIFISYIFICNIISNHVNNYNWIIGTVISVLNMRKFKFRNFTLFAQLISEEAGTQRQDPYS